MLSSLPAPLPETLPATFLPSPNATPSPPSYKSFSDYARSPRKRKASESSGDDAPATNGLGLGISMNTKRHKSSSSPPPRASPASGKTFSKALKSPELYRSVSTSSISGQPMDRSLTPVVTDRSTFSPAGTKKELSRSSLRNEVPEGEDLGSWSKDRFLEAGSA